MRRPAHDLPVPALRPAGGVLAHGVAHAALLARGHRPGAVLAGVVRQVLGTLEDAPGIKMFGFDFV